MSRPVVSGQINSAISEKIINFNPFLIYRIMSCTDVLLGLQWGDEGKGKVVDYLAPGYHIIARFQGGPNAGHTLEFDAKKYVLHTIPSGIFRPEAINVIGNGVVIDPVVFSREIEEVSPHAPGMQQRLFISSRAHLILPTHKMLDAAYEKDKGASKIGSTLRGIGPAYTDKYSRCGIRVGDILLPGFRDKMKKALEAHYRILDIYGVEKPTDMQLMDFYAGLDVIRTFPITQTEYLLNNWMAEGKKILAEGAQGTMLDVDFGSYPFVTSSSTSCAGAPAGMGIPPSKTGTVYGLFKAYCTRVGSGPFPTELMDETGERLRKAGNEFGSTTGRPRRCGWLDLVALKYAVMINGCTKLIMTKTDVLDGFEEIKVCTSYLTENGSTSEIPYSIMTGITPEYKTFKGWDSLSAAKTAEDIPDSCRKYIEFIEEYTGVSVTLVSVGPERKAIIAL